MAEQQSRTTSSRKKDHVELCVNADVTYRNKTAGFERVEFVHNALPELDFTDIDTATTFLGKVASLPLMISCMTGGYDDAVQINGDLAEVCEALSIPMGVGSQKQALESSAHHESFRIVRRNAPSVAITANIGAAEAARQSVRDSIRVILDLVEADALTVHLNPLQELLQPEGTPSFRGVLNGIEQLATTLDIPIIVKEVGSGISGDVARRLLDAGVQVLDVAGAGGTSWAGVEILRNHDKVSMSDFWDWGLPTVECLRQTAPLKQEYMFALVASGGVTSGLDVAKALALGADMGAAARVFLKTLMDQDQKALHTQIQLWRHQLQSVMFLTGSATIADLQTAPVFVR